jgi:hypothetical protein
MPSTLPLVPTPGEDLFLLSFFFLKETFLLVYDSYARGFIVTFPYIHNLYPELVHPLHYSPSYSIPLLMVT